MSSFKYKQILMQELAREFALIKEINDKFEQGTVDGALYLAETALLFLSLERFLRIILKEYNPKQTLCNLLEKANSKKTTPKLLEITGGKNDIKRIVDFRNSFMHSNFEQMGRNSGFTNHVDHFMSGTFVKDLKFLREFTNNLIQQINSVTGKRNES